MTIFVSLKTGSQRRGSRKQARKPAPGAASGGQRFVEIDLILKGISGDRYVAGTVSRNVGL